MANFEFLVAEIQRKGYKVEEYSSFYQFSFTLQTKDGTQIGAWHETKIPKRIQAKEEISKTILSLLGN